MNSSESFPLSNNGCYTVYRPVDISSVLPKLAEVEFTNTGGTNGWVAQPDWLLPFICGHLQPPGDVTFICLRKLPPYQNIPPHIDSWRNRPNIGRRFHVPLLTHPDVTMRWPDDGVEVHMQAGWLYEVCYTKLHEVVHLAPIDRVHLHYNVVN